MLTKCQSCHNRTDKHAAYRRKIGIGTVLASYKCAWLEKVVTIRNNNILIFIVMNIKPLADRVLVLPAAAEEKTIGGIIIPDTAKEKPLKGEVIAVGEGTKDEKMILKKGDNVLYGKYSGTELEIEGTKYLIMRQSDVLAILG